MTETLSLLPSDDVTAVFLERGWGDGLPIVAPTEALVDGILEDLGWDPEEGLGPIPPSWDELTRRALVVNAVMAGCRMEEMPLVAAALEAVQDESFNLYTVQTTTSPVTPLLLFGGPYARALGMNGGMGALGPGDRVSATVGRAVRLALVDVGGAVPGSGDRATTGFPGKFSWCAREHEEASPWEPFHVRRGYGRDDDVVTVFGAHSPVTVCEPGDVPARQVLTALADACRGVGTNLYFRPGGQLGVFLAPEHAVMIAAEGMGPSDVGEFLFEHARQPAGRLRASGYHPLRDWPEAYDALPDDATIPVIASPEDVLVVVIGGAGRYSLVVPTHGACGRPVSTRVEV